MMMHTGRAVEARRLAATPRSLYLALTVLFVVSAIFEANHVWWVMLEITGRADAVVSPFTISNTRLLGSVSESAKAAGLEPGDRVVTLNGVPYVPRGLTRQIEFARPGDTLRVTVVPKSSLQSGKAGTSGEAGQATREIIVPLVGKTHHASDAPPFEIAIGIVLPVSCTLLGFWIAAIRPRDPVAWMLLGFLLGLGQLFVIGSENQDGTFINNLLIFYRQSVNVWMFLWLMLIGFYFPSRLFVERATRFTRTVITTMVVATGATWVLYGFAIFGPIGKKPTRFDFLLPYVTMLYFSVALTGIVSFFGAITNKYFIETSSDARRRLRLFYVGSFVAFIPTLALIVLGPFLHKSLDDFSPWIELPSLLMTLVFPATLAYLIL